MPNVESREIRGVTLKLAILLISQAIVITATIVGTYSSLKTAILLQQQGQRDYEKQNDQKIQNLMVKDDIHDTEVKGIQQQFNAFMLNYVKDHSSPNKQ